VTTATVRSALPLCRGRVRFRCGRVLAGVCSGPLAPSWWRPLSGVAKRLASQNRPTTTSTSAVTTTTSTSAVTTTTSPAVTTISEESPPTTLPAPRPSPRPRLDDGSLGSRATGLRAPCSVARRSTAVRRPRRYRNSHYPIANGQVGTDAFLALAGGAKDAVPDRHAVCANPRDRDWFGKKAMIATTGTSISPRRHYLLVALAKGRRLLTAAHEPARHLGS